MTHVKGSKQQTPSRVSHDCCKKRIPIPEDLIHIRIPQIKNIVNEVNLQDFIPCGQDKARLRFETEILVLRDLLKLIDELK